MLRGKPVPQFAPCLTLDVGELPQHRFLNTAVLILPKMT